ncbi:MAG: hypothetical protein L0H36_00500 [bacterium]|nr:hypothetical protein [bacterium]
MYAMNDDSQGAVDSTNQQRAIETVTLAVKSMMEHVSRQPRPQGVRPGDTIVFHHDVAEADDPNDVLQRIAQLAVGWKLQYRSGDIQMLEMGAYKRTPKGVTGDLLHLMMHTSGYLKLMETNNYYDLDQFDVSLYTKSDSISFALTLYRL